MPRISVVDRLSLWRERPLAACIVAVLAIAACVASVVAAPGRPGYLGAGLALIAIAIAVIDARWFIIPNDLSAAGFALALVNAASGAPDAIWEAIGIAVLRGGVLALLFLGLREVYRRFRGRDGIGLGDVKLAGVAGAWLDWTTIRCALLCGKPRARRVCEISLRIVSCAEHLDRLAHGSDVTRADLVTHRAPPV